MRRHLALLPLALVLVGLGGSERPIGKGASQVWVLRPEAAPHSVVVFLHGWTAIDPADWHADWLHHLVEGGSAVLFPRYQPGDSYDDPGGTVDAVRRGLVSGFRALGAPRLPVVAAGYSFGGTLAFYYAANADRWHVPRPAKVYSVFPAPQIEGRRLRAPPPGWLDALILAGREDNVVGRMGADDFLDWLEPLPPAHRRFRLVPGDHVAPQFRTRAARRTFWRPLDELVRGVRGG